MTTTGNSLEITYALLLSVADGKSVGSGFRIRVRDFTYLVTARHVIYDGDKLYGDSLIVTSYTDLDIDPIVFTIDLNKAEIISDAAKDCAVIVFSKTEKNLKTKRWDATLMPYVEMVQKSTGSGRTAQEELTKKIDDVFASSTVFLLGYPTSLGMIRNDYYDFRRPLLRKGTIAGISKSRGTFVIDCASYPGNSGGPVVEHCSDKKHRLIGFVSRYIPFETKWYNGREKIYNTEIANSGYTVCVALDVVFQLISALRPNNSLKADGPDGPRP